MCSGYGSQSNLSRCPLQNCNRRPETHILQLSYTHVTIDILCKPTAKILQQADQVPTTYCHLYEQMSSHCFLKFLPSTICCTFATFPLLLQTQPAGGAACSPDLCLLSPKHLSESPSDNNTTSTHITLSSNNFVTPCSHTQVPTHPPPEPRFSEDVTE